MSCNRYHRFSAVPLSDVSLIRRKPSRWIFLLHYQPRSRTVKRNCDDYYAVVSLGGNAPYGREWSGKRKGGCERRRKSSRWPGGLRGLLKENHDEGVDQVPTWVEIGPWPILHSRMRGPTASFTMKYVNEVLNDSWIPRWRKFDETSWQFREVNRYRGTATIASVLYVWIVQVIT